jgi:hypothetical protein
VHTSTIRKSPNSSTVHAKGTSTGLHEDELPGSVAGTDAFEALRITYINRSRMVGAEQENEQGLRVAAGDGVNARLHGDDTTHGEAVGSLMRLFRRFLNPLNETFE